MDYTTTEFYDEPEYSDLSIKLGDGRVIRTHRLVLCSRSPYFHKLCGVGSTFAESNKSEIELREDDADAAEAVLMHIYGFDYRLPKGDRPSWRFHLSLMLTADKYLLSDLSESAEYRFRQSARSEEDVDQIHCIIKAISDDASHNEGLTELAQALRDEHLGRLVLHPPYRAHLETDMALLWQHFDKLAFGADLVKKHVVLCSGPSHETIVTDRELPNYKCKVCARSSYISPTALAQGDKVLTMGQDVWIPR